MALLGVDEVREFVRVAHEEDRRVVADQIPVAHLGIEFEGKAAHVALGVGRARLAGDGGKARQHLRLLADLGEELGLAVARDVVRDGEDAERAPALGMDGALGNALAVLMRQLLEELIILHQDRAAGPGGERILVVCQRVAGCRREDGLVGHGKPPGCNYELE